MRFLTIVFSLALLTLNHAMAQDRLFFIDGQEKDVKITEVSSSEVKYKRLDNVDGPTFSTLKSELFMIKYANGEKEMVSAPAQPQQPAAAPSEPSQPAIAAGGLSSAVRVSDEPAKGTRANVDKWGRSEADNRHLFRKKIIKGAILLGVGTIWTSTGVAVAVINAIPGEDAESHELAGIFNAVAGAAILIAGAGVMGSSGKYRKRANQLSRGTVSISPAMLNGTRFSGAHVQSSPGYGINLTYSF